MMMNDGNAWKTITMVDEEQWLMMMVIDDI